MSNVGGLSTPILQRVASGEVFVMTYYKTPVAYLVSAPVTEEKLEKCRSVDSHPRLRFLKTTVKDLLWNGESIGVTMARNPKPVAALIPLSAMPAIPE